MFDQSINIGLEKIIESENKKSDVTYRQRLRQKLVKDEYVYENTWKRLEDLYEFPTYLAKALAASVNRVQEKNGKLAKGVKLGAVTATGIGGMPKSVGEPIAEILGLDYKTIQKIDISADYGWSAVYSTPMYISGDPTLTMIATARIVQPIARHIGYKLNKQIPAFTQLIPTSLYQTALSAPAFAWAGYRQAKKGMRVFIERLNKSSKALEAELSSTHKEN